MKSLTNLISITVIVIFAFFIPQKSYCQYGNYFAGTNAGHLNTASYSTGVGMNTLHGGNSGWYNTATGYASLFVNTTGKDNTANGYKSLFSNTYGMENTALGCSTLYANTGGNFNTAIGVVSLTTNTTGSMNTAIGSGALRYNTTGLDNSGFGEEALNKNTTGASNTASGVYSLFSNTTGTGNTADGLDALSLNTTGNYNAATGYNALTRNTIGSNNSAIGYNSGYLVTSSNNCTFLGAYTNGTASGLTNSTAVGNGAYVDVSNKISFGNGAVTSIVGQVSFTTLSDYRLKKNITESKLGLDFILNLRPVTYNYKEEGQKDILYTGLIAQEVDSAAKKSGVDYSGVDKHGEYWGVRYGDLTVPLIKAVQEMDHKTADENAALKERLAAMEQKLELLQDCIQSLCSQQSAALLKTQTAEPINKTSFVMMPNPSHEKTQIKLSGHDANQVFTLKVSDQSGHVVANYILPGSEQAFELNTSAFTPGVYLVQLMNDSTVIQTQKLVVQ